MTEQEILTGLGEIIEHITERPAAEVTADKSFEELDIESLTIVEIVTAVEDKYEIRIDDDELKKLTTVEDLVTFIEKKAGSSA
jgi:acyl carrier protein